LSPVLLFHIHDSDLAKEWVSLTIHKVFLSKKVESSSSHGSDMAKVRLSLTIHKVFVVVKRWSSVLVTVHTWPRNGFYCSEKVESSSSHGSVIAKVRLSLTIYKVVLRN
jgi:hypothetical protein